jgi:hypothetical protein
LAVVAESVEETYFVMDSVFLGSAERQVLELKFQNKKDLPSIFLGDLLSWVELFATDEGPRLIRDGGKDGVVEAFSITARKLFRLVMATAILSNKGDDSLPASFSTARVPRALGEWRDQLKNVSDLAKQIRREPQSEPVVIGVIPNCSTAKDNLRLTIVGDDFQTGIKVKLIKSDGESYKGKEVIVKNDGRLDATFDLSETSTPEEDFMVKVINPDKGSGTSFLGAFKISPNCTSQSAVVKPITTASEAGATAEEETPEKPASDASGTPKNKSRPRKR